MAATMQPLLKTNDGWVANHDNHYNGLWPMGHRSNSRPGCHGADATATMNSHRMNGSRLCAFWRRRNRLDFRFVYSNSSCGTFFERQLVNMIRQID